MEYHQLTLGERYRIARMKSMGDGCPVQLVHELMQHKWSPQQISGRLRALGGESVNEPEASSSTSGGMKG